MVREKMKTGRSQSSPGSHVAQSKSFPALKIIRSSKFRGVTNLKALEQLWGSMKFYSMALGLGLFDHLTENVS